MDWLLLGGGLAALFAGGEALVRGAHGVTRKLGISPLLIGLTVVGFGTSAPERPVSVDATWRGAPDIAIGNIVGSNIFNVLGILGVTALIAPIPVAGRFPSFDLPITIAVSAPLTGLMLLRLGWVFCPPTLPMSGPPRADRRQVLRRTGRYLRCIGGKEYVSVLECRVRCNAPNGLTDRPDRIDLKSQFSLQPVSGASRCRQRKASGQCAMQGCS